MILPAGVFKAMMGRSLLPAAGSLATLENVQQPVPHTLTWLHIELSLAPPHRKFNVLITALHLPLFHKSFSNQNICVTVLVCLPVTEGSIIALR